MATPTTDQAAESVCRTLAQPGGESGGNTP